MRDLIGLKSLTACVGIRLLWEYIISCFGFFETYIVKQRLHDFFFNSELRDQNITKTLLQWENVL